MTIIEEVVSRMARYPLAEISADALSVTYHPATSDGFIVRLVVDRLGAEERYRVYYAGCCQERANREGSIMNFALGLSNGCRIREFSRRGVPYRWVTEVEGFRGWKGYWEQISFTGPIWQFWRAKRVRVLQNHVIELSGGCGGRACATA